MRPISLLIGLLFCLQGLAESGKSAPKADPRKESEFKPDVVPVVSNDQPVAMQAEAERKPNAHDFFKEYSRVSRSLS